MPEKKIYKIVLIRVIIISSRQSIDKPISQVLSEFYLI